MVNIYMITVLIGQQALWAKTFGGPGEDEASCIITTNDGGLMVAGSTNSFGQGGYDAILMKVAPDGSIQWARTYGGNNDDRVYQIAPTSDGGYIMVGGTATYGAGGYDVLLMKIALDGSLEWTRTYGGTGEDQGCWVIQTSDGGYAIAGWTRSYGAGFYDQFVLRLNSSGAVQWARTYGSWGGDMAYTIAQTSDGGFVIAGFAYMMGPGQHDGTVAKISSSGTLVWANIYGTSDNGGGFQMAPTPDGGFLISGHVYGVFGDYDAQVIKLLSNGSIQWTSALGSTDNDRNGYAIPTQDGGYVFSWYRLYSGFYYSRITKLNSAGYPQWNRAIEFGDAWFSFVTQATDGGIVSAGRIRGSGAGGSDIFILKIGPDGNYQNCVEDYSPGFSNTFPFQTSPVSFGATCSPNTSSINPVVSVPSMTVTNVCEPLYEEVEETGPESPWGIVCVPVPGGLLFRSGSESEISLYTSDGRLTYSGMLLKGDNRISLGPGVYLWKAGHQMGKALAR